METELEARIAGAVAEHERASASPKDRDDPSAATEIVARLLPHPESRIEVLRVFAELIEPAHGHGDRKWAVTLFTERVTLNVGLVYVGVILHEMLFLLVDPARLDDETRTALGPRLKGTWTFKSTGPAAVLYLPAEDVAALWPRVRAASQAFIAAAASRDTSFYRSHSPGFLGALETELGRSLPRPATRRREEPDITAVIARARRDLPPARIKVRQRALAEARQLIAANRRSLSAEDLIQLMRLFNTDLENGRERMTRFGQAMGGHSRNRIVDQAEAANHWIDTLWACESDADAAATIDRLRRDSPLSNAGMSFPTMVLHCKAPERWFPAQSGMLARGYVRLTGVAPTDGPSYIRACERLRALVVEHELPVVGLDIVAYFADHPEYVDSPDPTPDDAESPTPPGSEAYDRAQFLAETLFEDADLTDLERLLHDRSQLMLCGPPGTGKTWIAERLARLRSGGDRSRIEVVQFHPSYGYEDFIEGIRPTPVGGQMTYPVVPGVFLNFCERAASDLGREHVLVIDEINRGNLPRIFGELLFALERRGEPVTLSQSRRVLRVPHNLVLLGTMNTADQSIAPLDMALRRRFHFFKLEPEPERLERWLDRHAPRMKSVAAVMRALNLELRRHGVSRERLIGHSHFMRPGLDEDALALIWRASVVPLVEELLHGREELHRAFDYEAFVEPRLVSGL
ncbi:McrB family protein [Nannocystis bainbridge]|uniref:AAA family ATPase n=1 Tax=Nannocystis bainbridge TaxID=2995303 RepID=A0ABT5E753_9BACT|nr:AAA family ATPase [Nannocystis bainbridge]MDC0721687.1 AAA family ATPase [Nannocystis bainbridge]